MTIKIGTKFTCPKCQSEFIMMKIGEGQLTCCGQKISEKK